MRFCFTAFAESSLVCALGQEEAGWMRWLMLPLERDADVVAACSRLRAWSEVLGLSPIARARLVALGAEVARTTASRGNGSIEFGWSTEGDRPFCIIDAKGLARPGAGPRAGHAARDAADGTADEGDGAGDLAFATARLGASPEDGFTVDVSDHEGRTRLRLEIPAPVGRVGGSDGASGGGSNGRGASGREALQRALAEAPEESAVDILRAQNLEMARMLGTLRDHEAELSRALEEARHNADEAAAHALRVEEHSKRKDELLAVASHDLRSPVAAARGALDLLEPTLLALTDDQRHLIGVARRGCDSVVHLIGNLLSTALMELEDDDPDDPTSVDFGAITREVVEMMGVIARQKGVVIEVTAPTAISPVRGDPVWARQVITNLVNNAIKYAPKQGGQVAIALTEHGAEISLIFEDNGGGVPADKIDRVFDKLAKLRPRGTAGERGTGIGLYVTKKLVEKMKGTIAATRREPAGMHFEVRLPTFVHRPSKSAPIAAP